MKILGLKSKIKCGSTVYIVSKIAKSGLTLVDSVGKSTVFELAHIVENLDNLIMSIIIE
jgi:hypothetical protein